MKRTISDEERDYQTRKSSRLEDRYNQKPRDLWSDVEKLCRVGATFQEISAFTGISRTGLENASQAAWGKTFTAFMKEKACLGVLELRTSAHKKALGGNTAMHIFMLKNRGGMADKIDIEGEGAKNLNDTTNKLNALITELVEMKSQD